MRNDAHDELDHVPSLRADHRDHDDYAAEQPEPARSPAYGRAATAAPVKSASTGPLWALVGALMIALGGLGWWSFQQISLMEQQLVATQESFARISEEAAGRIQDISGKVVATESSVTGENEALKLRLKQLENKLAELGKQQQTVGTQQGAQGKRLEQLAADVKAQVASAGQLDSKLKALDAGQVALKAGQAELGKLDTQLQGVAGDVAELKKQGNPTQAISRLEQDLLVLRSELDNRQGQNSTAEFDAFRAQMTRNISTLQSQVQNLQQQISTR